MGLGIKADMNIKKQLFKECLGKENAEEVFIYAQWKDKLDSRVFELALASHTLLKVCTPRGRALY